MIDNNSLSISVFFPCYNDKGTIGRLIEDAFFVLRDLTDDFEVIVIDDGSTDGSRELLQKAKRKYGFLKLVFHQENQGYGSALQSGFKTASKDLIFYTDGDGQYDVKELPKLLDRMAGNIDIVNGYKIKRSDPFYRVVIGVLYNRLMKIAFGLHIRDIDCDFRLMRRTVFDKIDLEYKNGVICVEMIKKMEQARFRFAEVGVNHYNRTYGISQIFNSKRILEIAKDLIILWYQLVFKNYF